MEYENKSIVEIIKRINTDLYLPSIQRKFVWEVAQVENLFDSIMLEYPIGTFLFWEIEKGEDASRIDRYTFYEFINNYNEEYEVSGFVQKKLEKPSLKPSLTAVLDGQQRLSALFCALRGSYAYKTGKKVSPYDQYPRRELYFNPLYVKKEDSEKTYEFKFHISADSKEVKAEEFWVKVKEVFSITQNPKEKGKVILYIKNEYLPKIKAKLKTTGMLTDEEIEAKLVKSEIEIGRLWEQLVYNNVITIFNIKKENLDEVLDIFIRVNSGGTLLSKSDLLFSTVVTRWEEGRERIENLLEKINSKGNGFGFDNDFIFSICLALLDLPQVFKVATFSDANVDKMKSNWEKIEAATNEGINLLVDFGLSKSTLSATYIAIPIIFYFYKSEKTKNTISEQTRKYMWRFVFVSMFKKIFSLSTNDVVAKLVKALKDPAITSGDSKLFNSEVFDMPTLSQIDFQSRYLRIEKDADIDEILNLRKEDKLTLMALSLLYPSVCIDGSFSFHKDHMHPKSFFTKTKFPSLTPDELRLLRHKANTLVNLQLLEGAENLEKSNKPLEDWVAGLMDRTKYLYDNYIDDTVSLKLDDFNRFYELRARLIKNKLAQMLIGTTDDSIVINTGALSADDATDDTIAGAVKKVLRESGTPMTIKEIYNKIIEYNLYVFHSDNPIDMVRKAIYRHIKGNTLGLVEMFVSIGKRDGLNEVDIMLYENSIAFNNE